MNLEQSIVTARDRFWSYVQIGNPDDCWVWTGGRHSRKVKLQYGSFTYGGKTIKAHRVAYTFAFGKPPERLYVLHRCDNTLCCNPKHLFLGTHADNMKDMISKGRARGAAGKNNAGAKLTEQQVREIRASKDLYRVIAEKYSISDSMISNIKLRRSWRHLD